MKKYECIKLKELYKLYVNKFKYTKEKKKANKRK